MELEGEEAYPSTAHTMRLSCSREHVIKGLDALTEEHEAEVIRRCCCSVPSTWRVRDDNAATTHVIGMDSWCQKGMTKNPELLQRLKKVKPIKIVGHTESTVETIDSVSDSKIFGPLMKHPDATGTIVSQSVVSKKAKLYFTENGRNCRFQSTVDRKIILNFTMTVEGYEGVLSCRVNDEMWQRIVNADLGIVEECEDDQPRVTRMSASTTGRPIAGEDMTTIDYNRALEFITCHEALGHAGFKTIIRTAQHGGLVGMPRFGPRDAENATKLMGGPCPQCAVVNARRLGPDLNPQDNTEKNLTRRLTDREERVREEPVHENVIGFDLAYFNQKPYLGGVHSRTQFCMIAKIKDGKRTTSNIQEVADAMLRDFKRNGDDFVGFAQVHVNPDAKYDHGVGATALESDAEPALIAALSELATKYDVALMSKIAGSHIHGLERQFREIRRKQGAMTVGLVYHMNEKMEDFSWIEAANVNNAVIHSGKTTSPFFQTTGRELKYTDLTAVKFGDGVIAAKMSSTVGNSQTHSEHGICLGHLFRIRRGILFYNAVSARVNARSRYFRLNSLNTTELYGVNDKCVPMPTIAKTLGRYLDLRAKSLDKKPLPGFDPREVWEGNDPTYSPAVNRGALHFRQLHDEIDEEMNFDQVTNVRPTASKLVTPDLDAPVTTNSAEHDTLEAMTSTPSTPLRGEGIIGKDVNVEQRTVRFNVADPTTTNNKPRRPDSPAPHERQHFEEPVEFLQSSEDEVDLTPITQPCDGKSVKRRTTTKITTPRVKLERRAKDNNHKPWIVTRKNDATKRMSVSLVDQDKDVSWTEAIARWGPPAVTAMVKEIRSLADEFVVFLPCEASMSEPEILYKSRGFSTLKKDGTHKARVVVSVKTGKNRHVKTDFGVDPYAPTLDFKCVLMALSIAAEYDLKLTVMDVKAAYFKAQLPISGIHVVLNAEVTREVVKVKPEWRRFVRGDGTMLVEAMQAWYGLEPAAALWNEVINDCIVNDLGYRRHPKVHCLYWKIEDNGDYSFLLLHVDDIGGLFKRDGIEKGRVIELLEKKFDKLKIQDDDHVTYIGYGITWNYKTKSYEVDIQRTIEKACEVYQVQKTELYPTKQYPRRKEEDYSNCNVTKYRSLIGLLRYCVQMVKGEALYAVGILSTRQVDPINADYEDGLHVLRYLYGVRDRKHIISGFGGKRNLTLHIFCDASYANHIDGRSQHCVLIKFGTCRGAIFVGSWKQTPLASSVGNAEVICLGTGTSHGSYLQEVLEVMGFDANLKYYEDNSSCMDLVTGGAVSNVKKEKFMVVRINLLKEYFESEENRATLEKVDTEYQWSDIGTKDIYGHRFVFLRSKVDGIEVEA